MARKTTREKLETLIQRLHDSVDAGDGEAEDLIPVVEGVIALFDMPKAVRHAPPFAEYYHAPGIVDEMHRDEAQIWNAARQHVLNKLKGK